MSTRKRKHKTRSKKRENNDHDFRENTPEPDPALFIQAYEADVLRGPQAWHAALSLEAIESDHGSRSGEGLIRWGTHPMNQSFPYEVEHEELYPKDGPKHLWMDRYDVRLLLDSLPDPVLLSEPHRLSPTGWSDLPSDTEDTFFLTKDEVDDYHREKRRKLIDRGREERLRALQAEDGDGEDHPNDGWGGSDEEPDEAQRELMRRTASQILSSANPAQLEMRILANHGADPRFGFLRGRWPKVWKVTKARVRVEREKEKTEMMEAKGLGGLTAYGDSDDSNEEDSAVSGKNNSEGVQKGLESGHDAQKDGGEVDNTALKEARKARAKEWAEKRRALKLKAQSAESSPP